MISIDIIERAEVIGLVHSVAIIMSVIKNPQ